TDLFALAGIDANVTLRSPSLAPLTPLLGKVPAAPPLEFGGRLTKKVDAISMPDVNAKIGTTRIAGSVSYDRSAEPRRFRAELNSRAVRIEDLRWTAALARAFALARDEPSAVVATAPAASAIDRALPAANAASGTSEPTRGDRLDAEVRLQVDRLSGAAWPVASALDLTARLADGVLAVAPVAFGIGSGRASGRFDLDTNRAPAQAQLRVDLHDMKLESMLSNLPPDKRIAGALSGVVDLAARGRSPDEWLASAAGSVSARLHGGSMSRRLDAQLGLSGSRFLRALFTGSDERVPIRCAAAEMELRAGQARSRSLLLETDGTHVSGSGTANLKSGAFDLLLTPSPERAGLLELRKSIQLHGKPGSKLAYALVDATPQPRPRSCLDRSP
ncbi:MAG: AsmA family protein, partial [Caldimonas sp.]